MNKRELAQRIKASNYTCDGIKCSECISINGFNCCLQNDKELFVYLNLQDKYNLEEENAKLKRIVKMASMINKGIYTPEGIKAISTEAEQLLDKCELEELKRDKEDLIFIRNQRAKCMCEDKETITKAKDIIKSLMALAEMDDREYEEAYKQAEQFLKDN